jgi:hypothetical protein
MRSNVFRYGRVKPGMKVKRLKAEIDRKDGLHWSEEESIARKGRQTGCQAGKACEGGGL